MVDDTLSIRKFGSGYASSFPQVITYSTQHRLSPFSLRGGLRVPLPYPWFVNTAAAARRALSPAVPLSPTFVRSFFSSSCSDHHHVITCARARARVQVAHTASSRRADFRRRRRRDRAGGEPYRLRARAFAGRWGRPSLGSRWGS